MRPKYLLALALAVLTACADDPTAPTGTPLLGPSAPSIVDLYGVVEMTDDAPRRYAIRQPDRLVLLVGYYEPVLESMIGIPVVATGRFNDDGEFVVTRLDYARNKRPET